MGEHTIPRKQLEYPRTILLLLHEISDVHPAVLKMLNKFRMEPFVGWQALKAEVISDSLEAPSILVVTIPGKNDFWVWGGIRIPGRWQRAIDSQLLGSRYRRGDISAPHAGEHTIEHQLLVERFGEVRVLGGTLIDGVNAFPLACDFAGGGRRGNVEADMLLAVQSAGGHRLVLCEVKANANDPWYAAVELLRQMRLFRSNPVGFAVMQKRGPLATKSADIPVTGLVVAPAAYYHAPGKKSNAVAPTRRLFEEMRERFRIDVRLAVWEATLNSICDL